MQTPERIQDQYPENKFFGADRTARTLPLAGFVNRCLNDREVTSLVGIPQENRDLGQVGRGGGGFTFDGKLDRDR